MRMRFDNGSVHARSESEIIRIYDQPSQAASLAGGVNRRALAHIISSKSCGDSRFGYSSSEARPLRHRSKTVGINSFRHSLTDSPKLSYTRKGAVRADAPQPGSDRCGLLAARRYEGRLAQLVRAPALQAGGRRFESCTAHHLAFRTETGDVVQLVRTLPCHGRGRGFESRRPRHSKSVACRHWSISAWAQ